MEPSQFICSGSQNTSSGNNDQAEQKSTDGSPQLVSDSYPLLAGGAIDRVRHSAEASLSERTQITHSDARSSITPWRQREDVSTLSGSDSDNDEIAAELVDGGWKPSAIVSRRQEGGLTSTKAFWDSPQDSSAEEESELPVVFFENLSQLTLGPASKCPSVSPRGRLLGESSGAQVSGISGEHHAITAEGSAQWSDTSQWAMGMGEVSEGISHQPEMGSLLRVGMSPASDLSSLEQEAFRSLPAYLDESIIRQSLFAGESMRLEGQEAATKEETEKGAAFSALQASRSNTQPQIRRLFSADDANIVGRGGQTKGKRKRRADYSVSPGECHSLPIDLCAVEFTSTTRKSKRVKSDETLSPEGKEKSPAEPENP